MKTETKICHITSAHSRYDIRIFIKQCSSLANLGYETYLIVADGKGNEKKNGVEIIDVGVENNRLKRFLLSSRKVFKRAKSLNCNIYHFHDPELMFYGLSLKNHQSKVIYDIHEDLKQQLLIKPWIPKIFRKSLSKIFEIVELFVAKRLDALIVPQPHMYKAYKKINSQTVLVPNFVVLSKSKEKIQIDYNNKTAFHAGALTKHRGLDNMIDTYKELDDSNTLILAGNLSGDYDIEKILLNNENLEYKGLIDHKAVDKYYRKSSIGIILYNNVGQYYLSYAIKLFEYMKYAIPVIMPNFGEWIRFNDENDCGINVDVNNPAEVANAINFLNSNPKEKERLGINGKKAVMEKYNWAISENKLQELYNKLN